MRLPPPPPFTAWFREVLGTLQRCGRRWQRDTRGGVSTLVALSLPLVIGAVGLGYDLNAGYNQRLFNQRVADMAALGAALEYRASESADIDAAARSLSVANGLSDATIRTELLTDFPNAGDTSVRVTVTRAVPFTLAAVLGFTGSYSVAADAAAIVSSETPYAAPCFLALSNASDALQVQGGASIVASDCSVAAVGDVTNNGTLIKASDIISGNGSITLGSGTLSANSLRYANGLSVPAWNTNLPPAKDRHNVSTALADPWANSAELQAAIAQIGNHAPLPALSDPVTPAGSEWNLSWSPSAAVTAYRTGPYTGEYVIPKGNYTIGAFIVGGGIKVTFASGSNITIANGVNIGGGSTVDFGDSNIWVNGGFNSGSNGVTIGNGTLWIGSGTVTFSGTNRKGSGNVTINAPVSLGGGIYLDMGAGNHAFRALTLSGGGSSALGNGDFTVLSGVSVGGGSELVVGNGNIVIGAASSGNAITLSGSAKLLMGDGSFSANGHIVTEGGSRIVFGQTPNHYIAGNMTIAGAAYFGAGRYTVAGSFTNGTGGTTWPYTSPRTGLTYGANGSGYDMVGYDVSFVLSGALNLAGGAKTRLSAPAASVSGGAIGGLLVHTGTSGAITWGGGSSNVFNGVVHVPNATVTMTGGNSTGDSGSSGTCFMLIAGKIKASGGTTAGSTCKSSAAGASGSDTTAPQIKLVK
ncbi:pilus assembly protein TadG-related protein [Novosphingobium clariflavum]|uniref:Pilus assembly protein TadG-related protein n=1 Tax=Novosphingobium clariflavum TaxID=2029884 RepID=A0ABV6S4A1_9SPHN|nr:pilus assembly protein TadG-related protein [Novosphingobium clariflavum]